MAGVWVKEFDFLQQKLPGIAAKKRDGNTFVLDQPWELLRFGRHWFQPGWWQLECVQDGYATGVEVRLASPSDPLLSFQVEKGVVAIHLPKKGPHDVSVLISPWPGRFSFAALKLRRLTNTQELAFLANAAAAVFRRRRSMARIFSAAFRLMNGEAVGVRAEPPAQASHARPESCAKASLDVGIDQQVVQFDGFCAMIGPGDCFDLRAAEVVAKMFASSPALMAVYSDVQEGAAIWPLPQWDAELASHANFVGLPIFFREAAYDPATSPWQHLKRLVEQLGVGAVCRVPLPLVRRAISLRHPIEPPPEPSGCDFPRVSILIPTKQRIDLLAGCLRGLRDQTDYTDLEVMIIDNGANKRDLADAIAQIGEALPIRVIEDFGDFNFSRLINAGAAKASGDVLLLLNDDVKPTRPDWLKRITASVMNKEVGAVGARLLYPDESIQHAGVMLGLGGAAGHPWKGLTPDVTETIAQLVLPSQRLAVTGACLAVRRNLFDQIGGLDEVFAVRFNDIDFCLRLHKLGYRNIYRGDAVLVHHESKSSGADNLTARSRSRVAAETRVFQMRWAEAIVDDPFGSPAFDPRSEAGRVRRELLSPRPTQGGIVGDHVSLAYMAQSRST